MADILKYSHFAHFDREKTEVVCRRYKKGPSLKEERNRFSIFKNNEIWLICTVKRQFFEGVIFTISACCFTVSALEKVTILSQGVI